MSQLTKSYTDHLSERLKTPEEVAGYLNAALEEKDVSVLMLALRDVADAWGLANIAAETGLNRENLYRMLSNQGNPRLSSFFALLSALGVNLEIRAKAPEEREKAQSAVAGATVAPSLLGADQPEQYQAVSEHDSEKNYASTIHASDESLAA